jgi:hypothetical protein
LINIDEDQYLERIAWHSEMLHGQGEWYDRVVRVWASEVAPAKAKEYGIECWKRLGSKGLVVDINACFYRWLQLRSDDAHSTTTTDNALIDLYGYTAMYCVCLSAEQHVGPMQYFSTTFSSFEPWRLNEWLIEHLWEAEYTNSRVLSASRTVATQLAKSAWEDFH